MKFGRVQGGGIKFDHVYDLEAHHRGSPNKEAGSSAVEDLAGKRNEVRYFTGGFTKRRNEVRLCLRPPQHKVRTFRARYQGIPMEGFASSAASTITPLQVRPNFTSSSPPRKLRQKGAKKPFFRKVPQLRSATLTQILSEVKSQLSRPQGLWPPQMCAIEASNVPTIATTTTILRNTFSSKTRLKSSSKRDGGVNSFDASLKQEKIG
ncbi:hypothetical protein COCNU_15G002630 [Cocos nucifera]|uniref:Uncharacterized protein n=1 Tax=Cocos nucifera TaxID=13894 RepID=A0A8K0IWV5_COCNU|nr:hypothetical protein COCNU_15G002630 [Cocos nucifera]